MASQTFSYFGDGNHGFTSIHFMQSGWFTTSVFHLPSFKFSLEISISVPINLDCQRRDLLVIYQYNIYIKKNIGENV